MAHGNHEIKDGYDKVPKKRKLTTPGAGASYHYFNQFDYNNEPKNRAVRYGLYIANAKKRVNNYKKYGEYDWKAPHVNGTRYTGAHVNLDKLKEKENYVQELRNTRHEALKDSLHEIRNTKGNSQLKFANPDEIADGYSNAVRNAIRYSNQEMTDDNVLDTAGNYKRHKGWDED